MPHPLVSRILSLLSRRRSAPIGDAPVTLLPAAAGVALVTHAQAVLLQPSVERRAALSTAQGQLRQAMSGLNTEFNALNLKLTELRSALEGLQGSLSALSQAQQRRVEARTQTLQVIHLPKGQLLN